MTDPTPRHPDRADAAERPAAPGSSAGEPSPASPELSSLPMRVVELFVSPGKLFDDLRERPAWMGALGLMIVLSLATAALMPEELIRQAMMSQAPPEADPSDLEGMLGFAKAMQWIFAVLGPPLLTAVVAGLLVTVFNFVLGGQAPFKTLFASSAHALLIPTLGGILTLPLILQTGDVQTALALHLFVPGLDTETYLYRLLHGLNAFSLWCCGVLGVAVSRIYPGRSAGNAAAIVVAIYVGFKALTALAGGFG